MSRESAITVAIVALVAGAALGAVLVLGVTGSQAPGTAVPVPDGNAGDPAEPLTDDRPAVDRFDSRAAYLDYLRAGQARADARRAVGPRRFTVSAQTDDVEVEDAAAGGDGVNAKAQPAPDRIGTTNVQVAGLDEPDLVKAGERSFYYSPDGRQGRIVPRPGGEPVVEDESPRPRRPPRDTHVIDVGDPADPETIAAINESGRLLRSGDTLIVLATDHLQAYDVSDPASPRPTWSHPLNASLVTARQQGDRLVLVTESAASPQGPCPIEPLGPAASVSCEDVHHPRGQIAVDATYTAMTLDAASGDVQDAESFVGTARNTVVYVSGDAVYVTYTKSAGRGDLLGTYALEQAELPDHVDERIREIRSYDISPRSTRVEIRQALHQYWSSLPRDSAEQRREAFQRGFQAFLGEHQRDLFTTGIVRVGMDGGDLAVETVGEVPGRPLNQFSLDQHNGTLRLTTTIPGAGDADSANDLYVLDAESLEQRGSVTDMGLTERVYSVRYVGDTAYVVTFRRIDPFHVVDLSDPSDPTLEGELKLPGFSSYLHPVDEDHVLGIGREDGEVKAVLFDVSDPTDPQVADDLLLPEGWSAIAESHHAFTIDRRHGVFFLPAGDDGHVVDYTGGELSVETTVDSEGPALRARYVDDYLYVFGENGVVVVDELTWDREATLSLPRDDA